MKSESLNNEHYSLVSEGRVLLLKPITPLTLDNALHYKKLNKSITKLNNIDSLKIDLKDVSFYDSYLVAFFLAIEKECNKKNINFSIINAKEDVEHFINVLTPKNEIIGTAKKQSFFYKYVNSIGKNSIDFLDDISTFLDFLGNLTLKLFIVIFQPHKMRWKDFPYHFIQTGVNAVPITLLIVFLIGLISGYQGAIQLSKVGADIYIADLAGISITRELGPLMTAIIVAGRSGSAFAAEIGTMKVSEEVDALTSMGYDTMYFLVLPRVVAVMIAMPILVLLTDVAGVIGGLVAGLTTLEITASGYFNQLTKAMTFAHIFTGVGKSIVFGFLVSAIGCFRGMQVHGGAESVGKYTTASVVTGIFLIILFDALFSYIFQVIGI